MEVEEGAGPAEMGVKPRLSSWDQNVCRTDIQLFVPEVATDDPSS